MSVCFLWADLVQEEEESGSAMGMEMLTTTTTTFHRDWEDPMIVEWNKRSAHVPLHCHSSIEGANTLLNLCSLLFVWFFFYGPRILRCLTFFNSQFWAKQELMRTSEGGGGWSGRIEQIFLRSFHLLHLLVWPSLRQDLVKSWELNPSLRNWRFSQILLGAEFQFEELEIWLNPKILIKFEELGIRSNPRP